MLSDLSYFGTEKARSDLTTSTEHEQFYSKWEKVISSGMQPDYRCLDPMARWLLPKDDPSLKAVGRLK